MRNRPFQRHMLVALLCAGCGTQSAADPEHRPGAWDAGPTRFADADVERRDRDGDGFGVAEGDCDDENPAIHPGAAEIPNDDVDQDCDGEDLTDLAELDQDRDGFSPTRGDCDDTDAAIKPNGVEICGDEIDQNCDGADLVCSDVDLDGDRFSPAQGDCDDDDPLVYPGAQEQPYSGKDDDCDPKTPDDDLDGDGVLKADDCDDENAAVHPGAAEIPYDGIDQDCRGGDWTDLDGDGFDATQAGGRDCKDTDSAFHPAALDRPGDATDHDCDGKDAKVHAGVWCTGGRVGAADFDGDGKDDLHCHTSAGKSSVLFSAGKGTFFGGRTWSGKWCPAGSRAGTADINGDSRADHWCHRANGVIVTRFSNGNGSFAAAKTWNGKWCQSVADGVGAGDFDGDGKDDLYCHRSDGTNQVVFSKGDGQFHKTRTWSSAASANLWCGPGALFGVGDFNGDGKADHYCHDLSAGNSWVIFSQGDGTFVGSSHWTSGWCNGPVGQVLFGVGDFNGDARDDHLCSYVNGNHFVIFSKGDGTFDGQVHWSANWCLGGQVAFGDFDGDAKDDNVCTGANGANWVVFSRGDGYFVNGVNWAKP